MRYAGLLMVLSVAALMGGCAKSPVSVGHEPTTQKEAQTHAHWDILARDTAKRIIAKLPDDGSGFFVEPIGGSVFAASFRQSLINELSAQGVPVHFTRAGHQRVSFSARTVRHYAGQDEPPTGTLTALSALGYGVYHLSVNNNGYFIPIVAGTALLELAGAAGPDLLDGPKSEVAITIAVSKGQTLLTSFTNVYYVDKYELGQYAGTSPLPPIAVVDGGNANTPMSSRRIDVVSQ